MNILCRLVALVCLPVCYASYSYGGSATWNASPVSGDWTDARNWTPNTVPNGPNDKATFATSSITAISVPGSIQVHSIIFKLGASAYTITSNPAGDPSALILSGAGVMNGSGAVQNFVAATHAAFGTATITFQGHATAGISSIYTASANVVAGQPGGLIAFTDNADAGLATFTTRGSSVSGDSAGAMTFSGNSSANEATINNFGGGTGGTGGSTVFFDNSQAGAAIVTAQAGASDSTVGPEIIFADNSDGGSAQIELTAGGAFNNDVLDLSAHSGTGLSIGVLTAGGTVYLGHSNLTVGLGIFGSDLGCVIKDGGANGGTAGSITIQGTGITEMLRASTYTGGTTIESGALEISAVSRRGLATGTGPVQVNGGTLQGSGRIAGAVTIGTGSGAGADLRPGSSGPNTITVNNTVTFKSDGIYKCLLNTKNPSASQISVHGLTIESGAQFTFYATQSKVIRVGTVFTVIKNTTKSPISGTFANLADGATITSYGNNFQANYEGGDGNDLTMTVVP